MSVIYQKNGKLLINNSCCNCVHLEACLKEGKLQRTDDHERTAFQCLHHKKFYSVSEFKSK